jgi:hypothetical protein
VHEARGSGGKAPHPRTADSSCLALDLHVYMCIRRHSTVAPPESTELEMPNQCRERLLAANVHEGASLIIGWIPIPPACCPWRQLFTQHCCCSAALHREEPLSIQSAPMPMRASVSSTLFAIRNCVAPTHCMCIMLSPPPAQLRLLVTYHTRNGAHVLRRHMQARCVATATAVNWC